MPSPSKPTGPDTLALPNALPYRVLFEEHRAKRGGDFTLLLQKWGAAEGNAGILGEPAEAEKFLSDHLATAETAYSKLNYERGELRSASRKYFPSILERRRVIDAAQAEVEAAAQECRSADAPLKRLLHLCSSTALCLSGGGIRSASFSLGVLQGLAQFSLSKQSITGFLQDLDFLSTVSGGGYIGAWLMGWARRSSFAAAIQGLGKPGPTAGDPEPDPVRHLRDYTSFLAPRSGFSVDSATLVSIFSRNLLLVWIIFLPCLSALILAPRLLSIGGYKLAMWSITLPEDLTIWRIDLHARPDMSLMWCGAALIALAGGLAAYRASQAHEVFSDSVAGRTVEPIFIAVTVAAAWFIVEAWIAGWNNDQSVYCGFNQTRFYYLLVDLFVSSVPMSIVRLMQSVPVYRDPFTNSGGRRLWGRIVWSFVAPLISAGCVAALLEVFAFTIGPDLYGGEDPPSDAFNVLALSVVLILLMLGSVLLSGLLSAVEFEEEREWWGRAGGILLFFLLVWIVAQTLSWYSEQIVGLGDGIVRPLLWGSGSALFGGLAAKAGNSAASNGGSTKSVDTSQLSKWGRFLAQHELLPPTLSLLAIICIFLLVGSLNQLLLCRMQNMLNISADQSAVILFIAAVLVAVIANFCVNVNTFSLHGMYRMRLVRAFLGASNFGRNPDPFTNFDREDNLSLSHPDGTQDVPVHVIGTALNLVQCQNLAWQQRKAESFTLSPLRCGSWRLGYQPTAAYGGLHGITLGTAMAISGAAFNPNMGYNSSPLVTFVMTLFNARLGWWLPNPAWAYHHGLEGARKIRFLSKNGPTFGLASIVSEALGRTNDHRKWIQLSDGGHFDNLGLYEMVLRRCQFIVVVDASADRQFNFEDLGNAIRKINVDLGIRVTFPGVWPISNKSAVTDRYCAVGEIDYGCVDDGAPTGQLLYIKPQLIGKEPRDVSAYAASNEAFPHQSTANQFFNESQFESYRHLGFHAVQEITEGAESNDISALFEAARRYCS